MRGVLGRRGKKQKKETIENSPAKLNRVDERPALSVFFNWEKSG
jgi:hypothetical protein